MCRWAAYRGPEIYLEDVIAAPCQSLIVQSQHAREGKGETNGDGFGIAWYAGRPDPGIYRDILPAWSDPNLRSLARQVRSHLFLAHVRASTGTATNRANCHPFAVGRWCFMHNGQIAGYDRLRRQLDQLLPDELYRHRLGTTDSEVMFLLALALGLDQDPAGALARMAGWLEALARQAGLDANLKLTAALADGERVYALRYATQGDAPTLYHRDAQGAGGVTLASEPLDAERNDWQSVPQGSLVTAGQGRFDIQPFRPEPPAALAIALPAAAAPLRLSV
jgi:glutamine amidotransferase